MEWRNYSFQRPKSARYRSKMAEKVRTPYVERLAHAMSLPENQMSPVELAEGLDVTRQAIEKLLKGGSKEMSASNNARAARLLNVDPTWLALGEGIAQPEDFQIRWHERRLIELFRTLPLDEQDEFATSLETRCALHAKHAASPHPFPEAPLPPGERRLKARKPQ